MFQLNTLRRAAACAILLAAAATTAAEGLADLPTAKINGREMYYYEVSRGESIYGVAHKLGVDREELLKFNPSAVDGLKPRMRLYFPVPDKPEPAAAPRQQSDIARTAPQQSAAVESEPVTHVVKKGETLYGIARAYKLPIEQLIILNPGCDAGVKAGQRLVLAKREKVAPAEERQYAASNQVGNPLPTEEESTAVVSPVALVDSLPAYGDTLEVVAAPTERPEMNVAVVLPFMLCSEQPSRTSQLYTEFYKGLLLAADELRGGAGARVNFKVYDSANSADSARAIMSRPEMADADLIIAPDGYAQLTAVIDGAPADAIVLNLFNVKDDSYLRHPNVIQTNIPHDPMYDSAIDGFLYRYENRLPVFLSRVGGPADKESFVAELKQRLTDAGRDYREISFETVLREEDLAGVDSDLQPVVFVPNSGSASEFAKIEDAVTRKREGALHPDNVVIWGYPEWITFRDESFRGICDLDATIYSRFYADSRDSRGKELAERFRKEFGTDMVEAVPTQGVLGYDTGMLIIRGLREKAATGVFPTDFSGLQSEMRLVRAVGPDGGYQGGLYNEALLLIHFLPDGTMEKICL